MLDLPHAVVVLVTVAVVIACVLLHLSVLSWITDRLPAGAQIGRWRIAAAITLILALHVAEIWLFGIGCWLVLQLDGTGQIAGAPAPGLLDYVYYSAVVYTTLGFGDMVPGGAIRFMTGTEALSGLVLITWSASFAFVNMERYWRPRRGG